MVPHLQPIPMALLERYPDDVDEDVLKMLKDDPALFEVGVPPCRPYQLFLFDLTYHCT